MQLCFERNSGHNLHRPDRVTSGRGLRREHHCIGPVEDGIGDIRGLRPSRPRMFHHGFQHLGRDNHGDLVPAGLAENDLLEDRDLLNGHLHRQISPGHHNPRRRLQDIVEVSNGLRLLELGDNRNLSPRGPQKVSDVHEIGCVPHK